MPSKIRTILAFGSVNLTTSSHKVTVFRHTANRDGSLTRAAAVPGGGVQIGREFHAYGRAIGGKQGGFNSYTMDYEEGAIFSVDMSRTFHGNTAANIVRFFRLRKTAPLIRVGFQTSLVASDVDNLCVFMARADALTPEEAREAGCRISWYADQEDDSLFTIQVLSPGTGPVTKSQEVFTSEGVKRVVMAVEPRRRMIRRSRD